MNKTYELIKWQRITVAVLLAVVSVQLLHARWQARVVQNQANDIRKLREEVKEREFYFRRLDRMKIESDAVYEMFIRGLENRLTRYEGRYAKIRVSQKQ